MKPTGISIAIVILLILILGLQAALFFRSGASGGETDVERLKTVASALQREGLHAGAAEYFERYLETASLDPEQAANLLYTVGQLYSENLNDPERALTAYAKLLELYPQSTIADKARRERVTSLQRLGRDYDAQRGLNQLTTAGANEDKTPDSSGPVVATVGDDSIRMGDLEERILALPEYARKSFEDPSWKMELLRSMVLERLLAGAARRQGVGDSPELRKQIRQYEEQLLAQAVYKTEILDKVTVGPSDIQTYYDAHRDQYKQPRSVKAAHILCGSKEEAEAARQRVTDGERFEEVAKAISTDAKTNAQGGLLGAVRAGTDFVPQLGRQADLANAILALTSGATGDPVEGPDGWHLFHNLEETPERVPSLEEAKTQVESAVRRMREQDGTQAYLERMIAAEKVRLYDQHFPTPKPKPIPPPSANPQGVPGGTAIQGVTATESIESAPIEVAPIKLAPLDE